MTDKDAFNLSRPDPFPCDFERIVRTAENKPMSIRVAHREIAVNPSTFKSLPVGFEIAVRFVPKTLSHPEPCLFDGKLADLTVFHRIAVFVKNIGIHPQTRRGKAARFDGNERIVHQNSAGNFGAAGIIDDREF